MSEPISHNTHPNRIRPIVILGPTAGGKSELAVLLGRALNGQIIGADSMQVYREMNAGTAKPSGRLRKMVPHHLIDIVDPTDRFTVADWLEKTEALIEQLQQVGVVPIVVGGTNLYIKALLEGLFDTPEHDPRFREATSDVPGPELHQRLRAIDPVAGDRIHPNDRKKLIRALEVHHLTGHRITDLQTQWGNPRPDYRYNPILIGLDWPVPQINPRINRRVKSMFYPEVELLAAGSPPGFQDGVVTDDPLAEGHPSVRSPVNNSACTDAYKIKIDESDSDFDEKPASGVKHLFQNKLNITNFDENAKETAPESLPDEVRRLRATGRLGTQASQALGYKQILDHLEGRCTLDEAFEKTKILTRRFAKNQRSWLKRFQAVEWVNPAGVTIEEVAELFLTFIRSKNK